MECAHVDVVTDGCMFACTHPQEVRMLTMALKNGLQGVQVSTEASLVRIEKQLLEVSRQLQKLEWMAGGSVDRKFELTPNLLSVDQVL